MTTGDLKEVIVKYFPNNEDIAICSVAIQINSSSNLLILPNQIESASKLEAILGALLDMKENIKELSYMHCELGHQVFEEKTVLVIGIRAKEEHELALYWVIEYALEALHNYEKNIRDVL